MTPTEIVKLGSTFGNVNAYNPSAGAPPGWVVDPLLSKSDLATGFQATTYYNATTKQYWFAVAGTNDIKDQAAWNSALSGYSGNKAQIDFALGLMKDVRDVAKSQPGATVLTSGHSFGGQFTDIGTSVFGWQSVKFDAVGGSSVVNSSGFNAKLAELGIVSEHGTNAVSCNINGFGPFAGSLVGTMGADIPGTTNCRIDLPSGTFSSVANIGLTILFGIPGYLAGKLGTGVFQHDAGKINQAVQGGNFTVNGVAPTQPTSFQPYSITDEDGNVLRTIQGSDGKPLLDADGKPKLELILMPPTQGANGQTIQLDSNGRITSVVNLSFAVITNTITGDQAQPDHFDVLYGSAGGDDITGLDGSDALNGGAGTDKISGGVGDDLIGGGADSDVINGGAGNDWIFSAMDLNAPARTSSSDVWPPIGQPLAATATILSQGKTWGIYNDLQANGQRAIIVNYLASGTPDIAPDVIDGGDGDDYVVAGRGADYVTGGLGDDKIYGAGGKDLLEGGDGADYIWGDGLVSGNAYLAVPASIHGADYLDGGEGNDQLIAQAGDDVLFGGNGDDKLLGDDVNETYLLGEFHGNDYLDGGVGNDDLTGGGGNDNLFGGAGDDDISGDAGLVDLRGAYHGADFIDGGAGADGMSGGGSGDRMLGGEGNDTMYGDAGTNPLFNIQGEFHGNDVLDGGDGVDFMFGDGRDDTLAGGNGVDILYGDNLTQYVSAAFHGNDNLDGGDGNDTLYGGGGNDNLSGGTGDDELQGDDTQGELAGLFHGTDVLDGGDGNDRLFGQGGNDNLTGGLGADLLIGDGTLIDLPGQFHGNDTLSGGDGYDTLIGGGGADSLMGGAGNDRLQGDGLTLELPALFHSADYLDGGDGDDVLLGDGGADTLFGGVGYDQLQGGDGDDSLDGGAGNDILFGEAGNNHLYGGDGNDALYAGTGNDTLLGGAGNDQISAGYGQDIVDGGAGNDYSQTNGAGDVTVLFGRGDGRDVFNWNQAAGSTTTLKFKVGVATSDIISYRSGTNGLVLGIAGTSDFILIVPYGSPMPRSLALVRL